MRSWHPNRAQRVVLVVALGAALMVVGWWTTSGSSFTGWTAYAPLTNGPLGASRLHLWVRAVIWLALIGAWTAVSLIVLRARPARDGADSSSRP